jgi:F0F1-type ATP synthase assembly protein I
MQAWRAALGVLGVGWYIAIAIVLGLLGGLWVDGKLGTRPLFTIIGLIIGIMAAVYGVYQMFLPFIKNKQGKGDA